MTTITLAMCNNMGGIYLWLSIELGKINNRVKKKIMPVFRYFYGIPFTY